MTNTIYYDLYRDDASVSTSSEISQQLSIVVRHRQSVSSSLYSVIDKAIRALIFHRSVSRPRGSTNDGSAYDSSGILSSVSMPPSPWREVQNLKTNDLRIFSYNELESATRYFCLDSVLGQSGYGRVFKGWIDENTLTATEPGRGIGVAIKCRSSEGIHCHSEWLAEIKYLGRMCHPNLVRLYGYCLHDQERLLVYEFMPRGSLDYHLFRGGSSSSSFFSWSIRMKIAFGAAKGLAFLHRADIIHQGVQCSNILLDSDYTAKLTDFGLARDGPSDGMGYVSTRIVGTTGYGAPEYIRTGHLTAKCDVYNFGVVLLELLSGRRVDASMFGVVLLELFHGSGVRTIWLNEIAWTTPDRLGQRNVTRVVDCNLDSESVQTAENLILKCLDNDPKLRPDMDEVVTILEKLQKS